MRIDEVSHGELGKLRVDALRPTQLTLGMREVDEKRRKQIKKHKGDDLEGLCGQAGRPHCPRPKTSTAT